MLVLFYIMNATLYVLYVGYIWASTKQERMIMARIEEQNALLGLELLDPVEDAAQFQSAQNGRVPKEALL